ncbi:MAG TPA: PorV/PorQ family protein [bacterium]|nr:PorV/PorQ family protein [bacterium]
MDKTCVALLLIFFGAAGAARALGPQGVGTSSAAFLKLGSGARSEAMGEAYVGLADDAEGIAYNPAGMAQSLSGELDATHTLWFQGLAYDNFNAMAPLGSDGMLGGSFDYLSAPQLARTLLVGAGDNPDPSQNYQLDGSFSPYDLAAALAYARPLGAGLLGGASLTLIDQSIDTDSAVGLGLDLGLLWQAPPALGGLKLGLSVQNLGTPIKFESEAFELPMVLRGGASYRTLGDALVLSLEGDLPSDETPVLAAGAELNIADRFFPRVGWRYDDEFNPWTLGFGLRYEVWGLDLSVVPYGALGMTYRASVDWRFGQPGVALAARLSYASTLGAGKSAVLDLGMGAGAQVRAWAVYIYDAAQPGRIVRVFSGFGPRQDAVVWDARDQDGAPVPAGVYWAVLSVRYASGATVDSPYVRLEASDSAPVVSLSISPAWLNPGAPGEAFVPTSFHPALESGRELAAWRVDILDPQGKVFRSISGTGDLPDQVLWDGKGDQGDELISAQVYSARLWVKDVFGAEGMSAAPLSFKAVFRR